MAELFNVAKGKKVNALGSNTAAITDGITEAGVHWDGGVAPAQAIVDLGGFYRITAATLTTYYGDGRAYQFALYAGVRSSGMTLLYEQKTDEEATAEGYKMTFSAVVARYVKVVMLHNTANPSVHIADLAVYGEECPEYKEEAETAPKADPEDLAYGKPTRANVNDAFSFLVTDGDPESCWLGELYPRFVDVDLLDNYQLSRVVLTAPAFAGFDYSLYLSADGVNFEKAGSLTTTEKKTEAELALEGKTARVLRVLCTGTTQGANGASALCQVKAYGKKAGGEVLPTRKIIEMTTYEEWLRERENVDLSKLKDAKGQYNIQDTYTPADTVRALEGLIGRILGQMYVDWFVFHIDRSMRKNSYELSETENGKILIHADCGVSAATALNFYLKYYCKVQVTQQTKQVCMPEKAPHIAEKVCNSSPYEVRYAYNYCTLSYTMPFFGYDKWQRELDFLMLSGVNLILDLTGMEAVWVSYLQKLGYTADQAKDYVCGYCYKAWWLMGNLEGYGGPVADAWVLDTMEMARVNQRYMTVMGAQPALETFVGAMPESFGTLANAHLKEKGFSDVRPYMAPQGLWAGGFVHFEVLKRARALGDRTTFRKYSEKFLSAMKLVSELSTYNEDELLGNWIGRGVDFTEDERTGHYAGFDLDMMAYNAKILLTVWASAPITNYANRQFDGLMDDYFLEMWSRLFKRVNKALKDKTEAPAKLGKECFTVGWEFTKPGKTYRRNAANPEGDGADRGLLAVYRDVKKHMGNREELQSLVKKQDAALKKKKLKEEKAALSSTIATNLEH